MEEVQEVEEGQGRGIGERGLAPFGRAVDSGDLEERGEDEGRHGTR